MRGGVFILVRGVVLGFLKGIGFRCVGGYILGLGEKGLDIWCFLGVVYKSILSCFFRREMGWSRGGG